MEHKGIKRVELLMRSMLRTDNQWERLTDLVIQWLNDDQSK